jgi:Fe2+ transport system protein B
MRYQKQHLIRKKTIIVDKQGELKTKLSPMHPKVLFTQQFGLIVFLWIAFLLFVAIYTGSSKG